MKKRSITTLTSAILLNVVILVVLGLIFYEVRHKNQQISSVQNEISFESKKIDRLKNLQTLVETTSGDRELLDHYFLSKDNLVEFISLVEQLAKDAGVKVGLDNVGEEESENSQYLNLRMNISTSGSWSDVLRYIAMLENLPYVVKLDNFILQRSLDGDEKTVVWSARLTLRVLMVNDK